MALRVCLPLKPFFLIFFIRIMSKKCSKTQKTSIGGQAVLEGVMMRSDKSMATAVRDQDGIIRVETKRLKPKDKQSKISRFPFVRGCASFFQSLIGGSKVLMRSAEVYGEGEPSKFEKWTAEKLKINVMSVVTTISMLIGLALAIVLFMWFPQFMRERIEIWANFKFDVWAKNFIEGGIKLIVFVLYILFCCILKDIRRTFMYHGAEHKTISCYEKGLPLTVENAKKCSRIHDRCGTTFMVFVLLISIITFALFESLVGDAINTLANVLPKELLPKIIRIACKVALLPIVAGISYELLKVLSKTDCFVFLPLKWPGMLLQRLTTREPDDEMIEVAITAFNKVMQLDADETLPEEQFICPMQLFDVCKNVRKTLKNNGITEKAESEWIISISLGISRDDLSEDRKVSPKQIDEINALVNERITGKPLWYCVGNVDFYGYQINVDERALIPRPETELLVYNAKPNLNENSKVLDLCTGTGAIAIAIKKETNATVFATDVSRDALSLASENANNLQAEIIFVLSDMFENIHETEFDLIVSNPPYIISSEIEALQNEVKNFEPVLALDGGEDGLKFYKIIANNAKKFLKKGGILLLEVGYNQAEQVKNLLTDFSNVEIIKDYENVERIIKAVL